MGDAPDRFESCSGAGSDDLRYETGPDPKVSCRKEIRMPCLRHTLKDNYGIGFDSDSGAVKVCARQRQESIGLFGDHRFRSAKNPGFIRV